MSDLVAFLRARLDEDEAYGPRPLEPGEYPNEFAPGEPGAPARVLREVKAKRAIVERYDEWLEGYAYQSALEFAIAQLAAVYRDHPDYDPAWAV